ncbi:hypothetical protein OS493_025985 [Desmophyllum pertusum]|uniref:Bridge-like lipid transfer protein family member 1 N-terminal domain-containing protein n=1 Tax=Desmophyllum pertusum TaxID=174260 RepID=A0A9W9YL55_9CNID|nr:hypothetical protein OS493_025985 [Desmophyllum pertusum]
MDSNISTTLPSTAPSDPTAATSNEQGGLVFVVLSCLCTCLWVIYITFYHSRLMGYILTRLINFKYIGSGQYFKIGSFSFSILSGKIMFRDVVYVTQDLSFRIIDGIVIFKYWMPYNPASSKKPYQHVPSDIEIDTKAAP